MDFSTIGNVRTYARMANLKFAAKYRLRTGQSIVNSNGNINIGLFGMPRSSFVDQMMKTQKQSSDEISKKRLAAIKRKLMNGKKLSNEEMGFLLKNDSKLYNKAKRVEESREELKAALHRAKTKDEARKALMHAMMKASAECTAELDAAKSGGGGGAGVVSGGGFEASGDVGGMTMSAGGEMSAAMSSGGDISSASNVPTADVSSQTAGDQVANNQAVGNQNVGNQNVNNLSNGDNFGNVNGTQSSSEKDSPQDILEKFIMIIRALEDEWAQFSKSKQYKDLPEDHDDEQKIDRKKSARTDYDYKAYNVASAYRAAMNWLPIEE